MSGIVFYKTRDLATLRDFYMDTIGMCLWLDQTNCLIFKHGNMLLGFCERDTVETEGFITFFYPWQSDIDAIYQKMKTVADDAPKENPKFNIYHFFARDPDGRTLEFQTFLHPLQPYRDAEELLLSVRNVRRFRDAPVPHEVLSDIFKRCYHIPISGSNESFYFLMIQNDIKRQKLIQLAGESSQVIATAPLVIAICTNPAQSPRHVQDGIIIAYHFMLTARLFNLATCWIHDLNRENVKELLEIPSSHHIVTITPLGYPLEKESEPGSVKDGHFMRVL